MLYRTSEIAKYKLPSQFSQKQEQTCYRELGLVLSSSNCWQDRNELRRLVLDYLKYPSSELARLHSMSDRLGILDLVFYDEEQGTLDQETNFKVCRCCGFKRQPDTLPLCTDMDLVAGLGSSTVLLYEAYKGCVWMMVLATLIYSLYAIYTSVVLSSNFGWCSIIAMLMSSKSIDSTSANYTQLAWHGVLLVIVWGLWFIWASSRQRLAEIWANQRTLSASDFSILIERLPVEISQEKLQGILTEYHQKFNVDGKLEPFEIVSFNMAQPLHITKDDMEDRQLHYLKQQRGWMREEFIRWVRLRVSHGGGLYFPVSDQERQIKYQQFEQLRKAIAQLVNSLSEKAEDKFVQKNGKMTTNTVFVMLRNTSSVRVIVENNKLKSSWCSPLSVGEGYENRLPIQGITVSQAPEPEDVKFENMGQSASSIYCRKLKTYAAALIILLVAFLFILLLKQINREVVDSRQTTFWISVLLIVINVCMATLTKAMTNYQKNYTQIDAQRSVAFKTIFAQIGNMAVIPLLICAVLEKNVHRAGGLAESVYYLALANALLSPLLKLLSYKHLWAPVRRWWNSDPFNKLYLDQKQLNKIFEGQKFEVGEHYIYIVRTTVFTSFYLSLQPIIAVFSATGLFLMFWVDKYDMIRRSKRPIPGSEVVHQTLCKFIHACPLLFCVGALVWPWSLGQLSTTRTHPYIIGCIISVFLLFIPWEDIFRSAIIAPPENLDYYESRIFFTSEYDRMNPATKDSATRKQTELQRAPKTSKNEEKRKKLAKRIKKEKKDLKEDNDSDGESEEDDSKQTSPSPKNEVSGQQPGQQVSTRQGSNSLQQPVSMQPSDVSARIGSLAAAPSFASPGLISFGSPF